MRKILLISHGNLAKGAVDTLSIFTGQLDNITAISAYTDECQNPQELVEAFFEEAKDDQVICMSDVVFGSVNQLLIPYLSRENTYIFSGFNLPMLMQLVALPEDADEQAIANLEAEGKNGVIFMNNYTFSTDDIDDE
jgi:mannose/fructose-specific phosphotransferase system component IIA